MMKGESEENNDKTSESHTPSLYIPWELTLMILKKLPVKSLARFVCVSKHWLSIIRFSKDFLDSIVARSSTQPQHDHFIFHQWSTHQPLFVSSPSTYPQVTNEVGHAHTFSISTTSPHNTRFQYVRGLIGIISSNIGNRQFLIYNPSTRQSFALPEPSSSIRFYLFGYDPLKDQYKVVSLPHDMNQCCQVYTLKDPTKKWRNIKSDIIRQDIPPQRPVCIKGVIYFRTRTEFRNNVFMRFDVRSEKFNLVQAPVPLLLGSEKLTLENYHGNLGIVQYEKEVRKIWVKEDVEKKQEWFFYEIEGFEEWVFLGVVNHNHGGEIVFVKRFFAYSNKFCFLYYDREGERERYVDLNITPSQEIKHGDVTVNMVVPDHVDNTMHLY